MLGRAAWGLLGTFVLAIAAAPPAAADAPESEPGTLLVRFEDGASRGPVLHRRGLRSLRRVPRLGVEVVAAGAADAAVVARALERDPAVRYAVPNYLRRAAEAPDDPLYRKGRQGWVDTLRLPAAWDLAKAGAGQRVAVLDTGVDSGHPDLAGAVLPGRDVVNDDAVANDDDGHGTSVAGVAAARAGDGLGTAGVSWAGRVVPVKVLDADGEGYDDDIIEGIVWAADQGVAVINLSLGGPGASEALDEAIAYARRARGTRKRPSGGWESLTPTELEIVRHAAAGLTNPEIGARMFISRGTVKVHLSHIYAKLGLRNRSEVAAEAMRRRSAE